MTPMYNEQIFYKSDLYKFIKRKGLCDGCKMFDLDPDLICCLKNSSWDCLSSNSLGIYDTVL